MKKVIFNEKRNYENEKNPNWKGSNAGKVALHSWVIYRLGKPMKCVDCGVEGLKSIMYHWANISGKYKRDLDDYKRLCIKCHKKFDKDLIAKGETHGNSKFKSKDAIEIARIYNEGGWSYRRLGKVLGVSYNLIFNIVKGKYWSLVEGVK